MENLLKTPKEKWNVNDFEFIKFATQREIVDLMKQLEI